MEQPDSERREVSKASLSLFSVGRQFHTRRVFGAPSTQYIPASTCGGLSGSERESAVYILSVDSGISWDLRMRPYPRARHEWTFASENTPSAIRMLEARVVLHSESTFALGASVEIMNALFANGAKRSDVAIVLGVDVLTAAAFVAAHDDELHPAYAANGIPLRTINVVNSPMPILDAMPSATRPEISQPPLYERVLCALRKRTKRASACLPIGMTISEITASDIDTTVLANLDCAFANARAIPEHVLIFTGALCVELVRVANDLDPDAYIVDERAASAIRSGAGDRVIESIVNAVSAGKRVMVVASSPKNEDRMRIIDALNKVGVSCAIVWISNPSRWRDKSVASAPEHSLAIKATSAVFETPVANPTVRVFRLV